MKRGHSNERRIFIPEKITFDPVEPLVWTADIAVGTPARAFSGQSLLRLTQASKLTTKCAVSIDTSTPDMFLDTSSTSCTFECIFYNGTNHYNISLSSTGKDLSSNATADFGFGRASGDVVSDSVSVSGFTVSHGA